MADQSLWPPASSHRGHDRPRSRPSSLKKEAGKSRPSVQKHNPGSLVCGAGGWRQKDCRGGGLSQEGSKVTWPHHSGNRQGTLLVLPACFSSHVEPATVTPSFLGSPSPLVCAKPCCV